MPQSIEVHNDTRYILVSQNTLTGRTHRGTIPLTLHDAREFCNANTDQFTKYWYEPVEQKP